MKFNKVSNEYKLRVLPDVLVWELKEIEQLNGEMENYKIKLFDVWLKNTETPIRGTIVCTLGQLDPNLAKRFDEVHPHLSTEFAKTEGTIKIGIGGYVGQWLLLNRMLLCMI